MKKYFLIALLALFAAPAYATYLTPIAPPVECATVNAQPYTPVMQRYTRGVIFRLSKCGQPTSYLLATMHLDDPQIMAIYADAKDVLLKVQEIGFEFVEDAKTGAIAASYMFLPLTETVGLSGILTPEELAKLKQILFTKAKMPPEAVERMRPWAATIILQFPENKADGIALDARLPAHARKMGIPMFGLETPQEQYDIFAAIPHDKQVTMLKEGLSDIEGNEELNDKMLAAYLARDLKALEIAGDASIALTTDAWLRDYMQEELISKRNTNMVNRLLPRMAKKPVLQAVGALHVTGEDGILAHLEAQGYRIDVVK